MSPSMPPEPRSPKRRAARPSAEAAAEIATLEAMFVRERYLDSQPVGHWPSAVCKAEACWDRPHLHTALGLCPVRHGDVIAQGRVVGCYQP